MAAPSKPGAHTKILAVQVSGATVRGGERCCAALDVATSKNKTVSRGRRPCEQGSRCFRGAPCRRRRQKTPVIFSTGRSACSMFVKKDTRKIPDILADDSDEREELHLGRRCALRSDSTSVFKNCCVFKKQISSNLKCRSRDSTLLPPGQQPGFE